ncbi:MAG: TRAP transporter large permease subunit [Desulfobacterales bacterium]|nr:TRAP transporter large permease subunit [Desulfobacterales bacterium]
MFHLSSLGVEGGTFLLFGSMVILLIMGQPLAYLTGLVAMFFAYGWFGPKVLPLLTSRVYSFVGEYTLIAVPMFVFMASLLDRTNIAKDLYNAMQAFGGKIKGGVAVQTLIVAVFLAAMSGIIGGETVLLGMLALPQMLRLGYNKNLAIGVVCAGGSLGTMVPPSIVLIIYGLTASVSIGDLFSGAVIPALMLACFYMTYILVRCHMNPDLGPQGVPEGSTKPKGEMLFDVLAPGLIILVVLGSIYGGIASVTEAASVGVASVMLLSIFRKELNLRVMQESLQQTMRTCGMIIWIGISASALIGIYNLMGGNRFVKSAILGLDVAPVVIILVMMVILIFLGMFMDWIGVALLTMPIFVPIIKDLGYDPVWFGVLFCMNMQVSFLSPPFGPAAFYLKSVAPPEISLVDIFKSVWPFIIMQLIALGLLMAFPQLALWLPNL